LLAARGVPVRERDLVREPPDAGELRALIRALGDEASALVRHDDAVGRGLAPPLGSDPEEEVVAWLVAYPDLVQRPILQRGARAVIARPPERVFELA
jgi:arsenate reductase